MIRYSLKNTFGHNPPQYLGGVGKYDVFYWTAAYEGKERLIVKWDVNDYNFYYWDFLRKHWANSFKEPAERYGPTVKETEVILAMYECFAIKPDKIGQEEKDG